MLRALKKPPTCRTVEDTTTSATPPRPRTPTSHQSPRPDGCPWLCHLSCHLLPGYRYKQRVKSWRELVVGGMSPGAQRCSSCGSRTGSGGGVPPPIQLPLGSQNQGAVSAYSCLMGNGSCLGCCPGMHCRSHSSGALTPGPFQLWSTGLQTAVTCE